MERNPSSRNTMIRIGVCVFLASIEPLPYFLSGRRYVFHPGKMFCFQTAQISVPNFLVYGYVGAPTLPLVVCYFLVFKKIRSHKQNVQNHLKYLNSHNSITTRDINITKILFITVLGFLACWIPISIIDLVDTFREEVSFPRQVYFLYLILGNLSAVINPVVYGLLNKNLREEYKKIIFFRKKHSTVELSQVQKGRPFMI